MLAVHLTLKKSLRQFASDIGISKGCVNCIIRTAKWKCRLLYAVTEDNHDCRLESFVNASQWSWVRICSSCAWLLGLTFELTGTVHQCNCVDWSSLNLNVHVYNKAHLSGLVSLWWCVILCCTPFFSEGTRTCAVSLHMLQESIFLAVCQPQGDEHSQHHLGWQLVSLLFTHCQLCCEANDGYFEHLYYICEFIKMSSLCSLNMCNGFLGHHIKMYMQCFIVKGLWCPKVFILA